MRPRRRPSSNQGYLHEQTLPEQDYPLDPEQILDPAQMMAQDQGYPPNPDQMMVSPDQQEISSQPDQNNPFNAERYRDVGLPDTPISYGGGMTEVLLSDQDVPKDIKKRFWFIFNKDNVLTFLDEPRKLNKLLNLDIIRIDYLNSIPYYDYTFEKELEFSIIRNIFETKLDRALGYKGGNMKNERIMLNSQFSEQRQISEQSMGNSPVREGFMKRLFSRR